MYANQHHRMFLVALGLAIAIIQTAVAQPPDCVPSKLSDYQRLGPQGCAVGDKHFSSFTYDPTLHGPPATAIWVTPGTVTDSDDPALLFEAQWDSSSSRSSISYRVEVAPQGKPVRGASLEMQFGQITGTGEAKVAAELRQAINSLSSCGPAQVTLNVFLEANQGKRAVDNGELKDAASQLCVVTPVTVAPGRNGSASLKGFMIVFHSSPLHSVSASSHPERAQAGVGQ